MHKKLIKSICYKSFIGISLLINVSNYFQIIINITSRDILIVYLKLCPLNSKLSIIVLVIFDSEYQVFIFITY